MRKLDWIDMFCKTVISLEAICIAWQIALLIHADEIICVVSR